MSHNPKVGVALINLGTPDSPKTSDVRRYLREFLSDGRVIDINPIMRFLLVNLIIAPFRSPKSAKVYKELWTEEGSPIKVYGERVEEMLQDMLGDDYLVELGMRYQKPSIDSVFNHFKNKGLERIIVIPLFPQYASATTGSVHQKVMDIVRKWQIVPEITFIQQYFDNPKFIEAFAERGKKYIAEYDYDYFLFSYHGLPERQIRKGDHTGTCLAAAKKDKSLAGEPNCCSVLTKDNRSCYRAQCFATTRHLVEALNLPEEKTLTCFQSRLGRDPWIQPYTEDVIKQLVKDGKKKVLCFSPAFVADCLETTIEIGEEYKEIFEEEGGEHWQLVESLNDSPLWVELLRDMVLENSPIAQKETVII